jgi:hypothetical protein
MWMQWLPPLQPCIYDGKFYAGNYAVKVIQGKICPKPDSAGQLDRREKIENVDQREAPLFMVF